VAVLLVTRPASPTVIGGHPLLDAPAPDFTLRDLDGQEVKLSDYRGRSVIVNFWASWCIPCREEFPILKSARDRYAGQGLEVLGVVFEDSPEAAEAYMAKAGATWPALVDPDGAVAADYIVNGPPPSGTIDDRIAAILPGASPSP
jgi:cytochrome c biogenesis protein CcmG/thiol:disulfide interchange protein DsbE